jgi:hypothetical protein
MKLTDLIDLFVEREATARRPNEVHSDEARKDTSSLADIARILRELDGQYEIDHEAPRQEPRRH